MQSRIVDMCLRSGGFESQARPAVERGCAPGFVPKGCKAAIRLTNTIGMGTTETHEVGTIQSLIPVAIVGVGTAAAAAALTIDDLKIDEQSLFPRFKSETGSFTQQGLGLVSALTYEAIRSEANPFPPSALIDNSHQLEITVTNTDASNDHALDIYLYLANP